VHPAFIATTIALFIAQLTLPYRYAFIPILVAAFNLGNVEYLGQFTVLRILIVLGIARALITGRLNFSPFDSFDRIFCLFAFFAMLSAFFHDPPHNPYVERMGLILNVLGAYIYGKSFLSGLDSLKRFAAGSLAALLPLAIFLQLEFHTGRNFYYPYFGAESAFAGFRDGYRASGPFAHAILAGTAGSISGALFFQFWNESRKFALLGILACASIIVASNSSGPIASFGVSVGFMFLWKFPIIVRHLAKFVLLGIAFLHFYMNRPFYYIVDSIDFTGGSTGWHRARLIESSLIHLDEWWLFGTDYTRHWMATGVSWSPDHSDITNYYLHLGIIGGLPLSLLLIYMIYKAYIKLIKAALDQRDLDTSFAFKYWCLISVLAAHASSFTSISYFDQMYVTFYLLIAMVAGLPSGPETPISKPLERHMLIEPIPRRYSAQR